MKFKLDENLPSALADYFTELGFDAKTVNQENLGGAPDEILSTECQTEDRILITLDLDFANIFNYPPDQYPGFIVIRTLKQDINALKALIKTFIPYLKKESIKNRLCILEQNKYRIYGG